MLIVPGSVFCKIVILAADLMKTGFRIPFPVLLIVIILSFLFEPLIFIDCF